MTETNKINKIVKIDLINSLREHFPQIFEDGKIHFDKLKELLSEDLINKKDDRFYFNWADKNTISKVLKTPAYGTLKPDKKASLNFDATRNLMIVGENLEVLKLILKPYFGQVKMIYIDPPYNTGKDFIYSDNFTEPLQDYLEKTGQIDSEGNKLTTNTESSGRYHSDWLNFMYPRLFFARHFLTDDGVIYISIGHQEVHHLRMIMDEIFGEENFIAQLVWENKEGGGSSDSKHFKTKHEYILAYAKNRHLLTIRGVSIDNEDRYTNEDEFVEERGKYLLIKLNSASIQYSQSLDYPIKAPDNYDILPSYGKKRACWRWKKEKVKWGIENKFIVIKRDSKGEWAVYSKQYLKVDNENKKIERTKRPMGVISEYSSTKATKHLEGLFDGVKVFDYSKPYQLIQHLISLSTSKNDIILDFFAGSGTTAEAVFEMNKEDGGNRHFVIVNLDEETLDEDIKKDYPFVTDVCKERLKRVFKSYISEQQKSLIHMDTGFKVFELSQSNLNLKEEFLFEDSEDAEKLKKEYLKSIGLWINEPLIGDWESIDVIYELMLKNGYDIHSKITDLMIKGTKFYKIRDEKFGSEFYVTLEDSIKKGVIEEIGTEFYRSKLFIFLDKALSDNDKINLSAFVKLKVI